MTNLRFAPFICALFVLFSCQKDTEKKVEEVMVPAALEGINGLEASDKACLQKADRICELGVAIAVLGGALDEIGYFPGTTTSDTLFEEEGYQWRGKEIVFSDGSSILVEGDYVDAGDPAGKLPNSKVNRVRVESSRFSTMDEIKIGSTKKDLVAIHGDSVYVAYYLADKKIVDVRFPNAGNLHYVFEENGNQFASQVNNPDEVLRITLDAIPENKKVIMIVASM